MNIKAIVKYLFFTRWTKENSHDIFWVSSDIINELKQITELKKINKD
jgi:hypothetical protein